MAQVHDDQEDQAVQPPVSNGVVSNGVDRPYRQTFLYVENLDQKVSNAHLYDLFIYVGMLDSVWVERDLSSGSSLGYGYVKYCHNQDDFISVARSWASESRIAPKTISST
ncbi:polyadenylate-binding protein, cytoplasmic and nuclear-like [Juglans regia]|uniref:Polyadenylate-binding protein, cytoplasmic and nuclear-like n=1 Tax=Juglans regia TaxID=51240 RepID=A0A2I4E2V0_JUGRE|nr:polyadenylate-binding protein, cytoplasmic and nuclear-like [Juglans regia]